MKKVLALGLVIAMIFAFAGCSVDNASSSAPAETTQATKTEAPATAEATTSEATAEATTSEDTSAAIKKFDPKAATNLKWPTKDEIYVGYSQADLASTWRTVETDDMVAVAKERGYKFETANAEGDAGKQISDVEALLAKGCNIMVITAIDADAVQPALDACKEKGVPVFLKSRGSNGVAGEDYVSFLASDFVWEGEQAATYIADHLKDKDKIKVIEIQGVVGGTDVRDRAQGFQNIADEKGNFEFVATQSANWSRSEAQEVVQNVIQSTNGDFDAIYCQNDEMALGATLALQAAGMKINEDVILVGVDGMKEALDAIKSGSLSATVTCTPKFAAAVFDTIEKCIAGESIDTYIATADKLVTSENVDEFYSLAF